VRPRLVRLPPESTQGEVMTVLSLLLSAAAFVYLVYAMLRPEKF
jgi:K+-transporting ATPase KdpF subunit